MTTKDTIAGLGTRADFVGSVPNVDTERLRLNDDEKALFARVGRAIQIEMLIKNSGWPESRALAALLGLRAKGAVVPARVTQPAPAPEVDTSMLEDVELEPERRKEILELDRQMDAMNHFEVLGLRGGEPPEVVKKKFYELSRRFHPDRYFGKNIGSFKARVERIFRRLSEAHQVLTDAERRTAYFKERPDARAPKPTAQDVAAAVAESAPPPRRERTPEDDQRDAERRQRLMRHPYLAKSARVGELIARAKANIQKGEFGLAYTDLHLASQVEPRNSEVKSMLGEVRRKHEHARAEEEYKAGESAENQADKNRALTHYKNAASIDAGHAKAQFRAAKLISEMGNVKEANPFASRAVELEPKNLQYRMFLGELLAEAGMKALARKHFEEAARIAPNDESIKKRVKGL